MKSHLFSVEYIKYYEGQSISNQPDLFLTDRHSQDYHSVFGHHNKTYVQNLSIIGSFVDNLNIFKHDQRVKSFYFIEIGVRRLLRKFYYLIDISSMKNEVCMCNISMERKICRLLDGIKKDKIA